jgi:protein TonB
MTSNLGKEMHMNFDGQRRNPTGIAVVVLLHVAVALIAVQNSKVLVGRVPPGLIDLVPVTETPPPPPPPPVPMPDPVKLPPTTIAVPDLPQDVPVPTDQVPMATRPASDPTPPATASGTTAPTQATDPAPKAPVRVAAVVDAKACTRPEYPRGALRNGDTGTVTLALLVGTDGRVAESKVERSSGSRELDRAAQAGLALCRFQPGTVDGVPQQSWTRMEYVWSLED